VARPRFSGTPAKNQTTLRFARAPRYPKGKWPTYENRTAKVPGAVFIDRKLFDDLNDFIESNNMVMRNVAIGVDGVAMLLARTCEAFAQGFSRGPVDPDQRRPEAAWKIPVRRISGAYYMGWRVRRLAIGVWECYNISREAYFIEFGIHRSPRRRRRPILKRSTIKTLQYVRTTNIWRMIAQDTYGVYGPKGRSTIKAVSRQYERWIPRATSMGGF
jgi:hypothetical protein